MASIFSVNGTDELVFKHAGVEHTLNTTTGELSAGAKKITQGTAAIVEDVLKKIKTGNLDAEVRALLADPQTVAAFKGLGADYAVAEEVHKAANIAEAMSTKINATGFAGDKAALKEVRTAMVAGGELATNFLPEADQLKVMVTKNFSTKLNSLQAAYTEVKGLLDAAAPDAAKIEAAFIKHSKLMPEIGQIFITTETPGYFLKLSKAGVNLADIEAKVEKGVKAGFKEAKAAMAVHKDALHELNTLKAAKGTSKEALDAAAKLVEDSAKKFTEHTGGKYGALVFDELKKNNKAELDVMLETSKLAKEHYGTVIKSVEAGAKNLAKEGGNFLKSLYTHTKGENIGKVHNWKVAGLVGAGAVVAYAVAGTGKKGKAADMNAEQIQAQLAAQQGQQPEVAGAAR